jgi:hypothetical protein
MAIVDAGYPVGVGDQSELLAFFSIISRLFLLGGGPLGEEQTGNSEGTQL